MSDCTVCLQNVDSWHTTTILRSNDVIYYDASYLCSNLGHFQHTDTLRSLRYVLMSINIMVSIRTILLLYLRCILLCDLAVARQQYLRKRIDVI